MDFAEGNGACSMADSSAQPSSVPAWPREGQDQGQETAKQVASKFQVTDKGCGRRCRDAGKTWQCLWLQWHVSFSSLSISISLPLALTLSLSLVFGVFL